jgi:hypothetical protein
MKVKCESCKKEFNRKPSMVKLHIYCSIKCRDLNKGYKFKENITEKEALLDTYTILSNGVVINKKTNKKVIFNDNGKGYLVARLNTPYSKNKDGRKPYKLHRLIAMIYLDNFDNNLHINHKDGDKLNNDISNLEIVTQKENNRHAWDVLKIGDNKKRDEYGRFINN